MPDPITNYNSSHTGATIDAVITKAAGAPDNPISEGMFIVQNEDGTNTYIPLDNIAATAEEIAEILALLE